jgi:putative flippase GtrA
VKLFLYFLVGGTAAVVDIGVFGLLVKVMGWPWFPVAMFSFVLATVVNYILSIRFVFKSGVRFTRHTELLLIFVVSALGLAVNQAVLWLLIANLHWDPLLAKVTATGSVFFWNYWARRHLVFKPAQVSAQGAAEREPKL